jgi:hypothetical protein
MSDELIGAWDEIKAGLSFFFKVLFYTVLGLITSFGAAYVFHLCSK